MLDHWFDLPLATQLFYFMVYFITLEYTVASFSRDLKRHWRVYYIYTAVVFCVYSIYITLRLTGALDRQDYSAAVVWFGPLLAGSLIFPALLIHWEKTFFKKALKRTMPLS